MANASFRFYEELNDFLPGDRRKRSFSVACARDASVKHMIEALGVPHTEVELILVNGVSVGFDHLIQEGDRVAVYPKFEALDITPLLRVRCAPGSGKNSEPPPEGAKSFLGRPGERLEREWPLRRMRFVADAHLGGLARLLRMAGFDTRYDNHVQDAEVERMAVAEGRIVLSRDLELLKRRRITHGCFIHALMPWAQLREVVDRLDLARLARPFSLCLVCNAPLHEVDKDSVMKQLPPAVRVGHAHFRTCRVCGRVYWQGSHWRRMAARLEEVLGKT